jgi:uncharacterized protein
MARRELSMRAITLVFALFGLMRGGVCQKTLTIGTVKPLSGTVYLHRATESPLEKELPLGLAGADVYEGDALHFRGEGKVLLKMTGAPTALPVKMRDERYFLHARMVLTSTLEAVAAAKFALDPGGGRLIFHPSAQRQITATPRPRRYFALVIGIDDYKLLPGKNLMTPVHDAMALETVLTRDYGFEVTTLLNEDATRERIMEALRSYEDERQIGSDDNLLIYFAGHGYENKKENSAYWIPENAATVNGEPITSSDVTDIAQAIPARHVLVVADSCYAGGMGSEAPIVHGSDDQAQFLRRMRDGRSRNLMASGDLEPVADVGPDGHSPFAHALLEGLTHPKSEVFEARTMFDEMVYGPVTKTWAQTPKYVNLKDSKEDTGDFVFVRTSASPQEVEAKLAEPGSTFTRGVELYDTNRKAEALPLFDAECKSGNMHSCLYLGMTLGGTLQQEDFGVERDLVRAATLFGQACDKGELRACMLLGNLWETGLGVPKANIKNAEKLFARACNGDYSQACRSQGVLYVYSFPGWSRPDYVRAAALFRKACDGNGQDGCYSLGDMYEKGYYPGDEGYEKNEQKAVALYREACDRHSRYGCLWLAKQYQSGGGIEHSDAAASGYFKKACDLDGAFGCLDYVDLTLHGGKDLGANPKAARDFLDSGCRNSRSWGCVTLGSLHERGEEGFSLDTGLARELYERVCVDGLTLGCVRLGSLYERGVGVKPNPEKAMVLYRKSCEAGDTVGCDGVKRLGAK